MEKYQSKIILPQDIKIDVGFREDDYIYPVKITHIPTGIVIEDKDKGQLQTYNKIIQAMEQLFYNNPNRWNVESDVENQSVLMGHQSLPCSVCGHPTQFVDYCIETRLCSELCSKTRWAEISRLTLNLEISSKDDDL